MIHLDYLLIIGILLSILLFLLVGVFYYSKSELLKGINIWFLIILSALLSVNVNIRMYNFDDVQCTVIPSVAYGFVTGMNLQLC